jgi:putative phosphoribosyl transferase
VSRIFAEVFNMLFINRSDAGRKLAQRIRQLNLQHPLVVALPRGGVPIGLEVARVLGAPLEIAVVRKIGAPDNPEFGIGAVTEDHVQYINHRVAAELGISPAELEESLVHESRVVQEKAALFREGRAPFSPEGRTAIVVDDGLATGGTALVACRMLRKRGAKEVILAVPVGAASTARWLKKEFDQVICLAEPENFGAVGFWYEDFSPVSDRQVLDLLDEAAMLENNRLHAA